MNSKALKGLPAPRTVAADVYRRHGIWPGPTRVASRAALRRLFGGAVSKDYVSRTWRKVKTDWDAWNAPLAGRRADRRLILDARCSRSARPQSHCDCAARS